MFRVQVAASRRSAPAGACRRRLLAGGVLNDGARRRRRGAASERGRKRPAGHRRVDDPRSFVHGSRAPADASIGLPRRPAACPATRRVHAFVDFQNDITAKDLELATREGFRSVEHVKRYTTTGMATDQGKTSNMQCPRRRLPGPGQAHPRDRPHHLPPALHARYLRQLRRVRARRCCSTPCGAPPIHDWAEAQGAVFEDVGLWKRARYFPEAPGEDMHAAVARECLAVRKSVGLFDASTLGKIEVVGPDAAEFMNRMYINAWTKLGVGRCRYGVMLREDGFVSMTASSAGSPRTASTSRPRPAVPPRCSA